MSEPSRRPVAAGWILVAALVLGAQPACRRSATNARAEDAAPSASAAPALSTAPSAVASAPAPAASASASPKRELSERERARLKAAEAALGRGRKATRDKKYDLAAAAFTEALTADPTDFRALAERGFARLLDGDLDDAASDLEDALLRSGDPALLASVWFNLGLLHEKREETEEARAAFANAHLLKPSSATKAKLQGKSTCSVSITRRDIDPLVRAEGWLGVYSSVGAPDGPMDRDEHGDTAAANTEAEAKALFCTKEGAVDRACDPGGAVRIERGYLLYTWNVIWAFPREKGVVMVRDSGTREGNWPRRCTGSTSSSAFVEGDVARLRVHHDGAGSAYDGEVNDEGRCKDGLSWTEETFFDLSRGKGIVSVRWLESSGASVRVDKRTISVSGPGCDEHFTF